MTARKHAPEAHDDLARAQQELERIFARLGLSADGALPFGAGEWVPCVDVYEADGKLTVVMEVPGLSPESLQVTWRDGRLKVSGERRERRPSGAVAFLCMERPHGRFQRTLWLDLPVDVRKAEARLSGGLLTIVLPKLDDRRGRETAIPVQRP